MSYDQLDEIEKDANCHHTRIPARLFHFCQNTTQAAFLAQIIFWYKKGFNTDGWFYKTTQQWHDEIGIDYRTLRRDTKIFIEAGIIETKIKIVKGHNRTVFYLLNYSKLKNILKGYDKLSELVMTKSQNHIHSKQDITATSALTKHHAVSEREYHPQYGTTSKLYTP